MVYSLWFMVHGSWFIVYGLWFMVHGSWFLVYGSGCMVHGVSARQPPSAVSVDLDSPVCQPIWPAPKLTMCTADASCQIVGQRERDGAEAVPRGKHPKFPGNAGIDWCCNERLSRSCASHRRSSFGLCLKLRGCYLRLQDPCRDGLVAFRENPQSVRPRMRHS